MTTIIKFFEGKKTYIVAILMVITAGLYQQGYIDETTFKAIEGVLAGGGFAALRSGMVK